MTSRCHVAAAARGCSCGLGGAGPAWKIDGCCVVLTWYPSVINQRPLVVTLFAADEARFDIQQAI